MKEVNAMNIEIIPQPAKVEILEGIFESTGLPSIRGAPVFQAEIGLFREQIYGDLDISPGETAGEDRKPGIFCVEDRSLSGTESYRMTVGRETIEIGAPAPEGLSRGLQVLRQLILSGYRNRMLRIPCADIADYPRFSWRGFMLDTSRHWYTPAFIKKLLDLLSLHHINIFHWHLTDDQGWRFPVEEFPALTGIGSKRRDLRMSWESAVEEFYTLDDIRDIIAYAGRRHITIVPEVDLPGHTSAVLAAYPDLGCTGGPYQVEGRFGIFDDILCAGNDRVFDLVRAVFDTLVRLFPGPYVHIGGDEVLFSRWEACPRCRKRRTELGLSGAKALQGWMTARFARMLLERNRIPLGWDEVLEDAANLPPELVIMSWRNREGGRRAAASGHRAVMSPLTQGCYLDYKHLDSPEEPGQSIISTVYQSYMMDPVDPEMTEEEAARILGGQGNLWSELIYADKLAEYMIFPRICALAEALWTKREGKDFDSFAKRLPVHQERLDRLHVLQYRGPLGQDPGPNG
jgi:hexosaminidase